MQTGRSAFAGKRMILVLAAICLALVVVVIAISTNTGRQPATPPKEETASPTPKTTPSVTPNPELATLAAKIPGAPPPTEADKAKAEAEARAKAKPVLEKFQKSPAVFIENQGQWEDASIRFVMSTMGVMNAGLTSESVRFQFFQREADAATSPSTPKNPSERMDMRMRREMERHVKTKMKQFAIQFDGARTTAPTGENKSEQVFHYQRGDQSRWRENVPSWNAVVYRGLWDGVDLRITGQQAGIKYEFHVAPGKDWRQIRLCYAGLDGLKLLDDGALELNLGEGWKPLLDGAPYVYQDTPSGRKQVASRFSLTDGKVCGYDITGPVDPTLPLVIDPVLTRGERLATPPTH
jgi:hypothetical protein